MSSTVSDPETIDGHGMTCRELVDLVTEYLDGGLSENDRRLFEAHLDICEGCHRHLEQIRLTVATTGRLRQQDLPEDARKRLLAAYRSWKGDRR